MDKNNFLKVVIPSLPVNNRTLVATMGGRSIYCYITSVDNAGIKRDILQGTISTGIHIALCRVLDLAMSLMKIETSFW